jgi:peptidoglycan/xylan/chitin deacetylase (PgdA/CDA1 family)
MNKNTPHTICLTFDFDALCVWLSESETVTPAMLSRGEFGARVGVPRILALLKTYKIPATFFIPGHTAESFPDSVEAILTSGHEIGHHGYGHVDPSNQSPAEERHSLERGLEVLERFTGHPPLGYRSPSWDYSATTLPLLVEYGFLYDSSLFADDYHPYHPRIGDQVSLDEPLQAGKEVDLWEFPVDFTLDDWAHFVFRFDPYRAGLSAPSKVLEVWQSGFDYMVEHEKWGVYTVTMHPQVIGRGHRIGVLDNFIQHVSTRSSVRFARIGEVAKELSSDEPGIKAY